VARAVTKKLHAIQAESRRRQRRAVASLREILRAQEDELSGDEDEDDGDDGVSMDGIGVLIA
jgi:hypothetical protein